MRLQEFKTGIRLFLCTAIMIPLFCFFLLKKKSEGFAELKVQPDASLEPIKLKVFDVIEKAFGNVTRYQQQN